MATPGCDPRLIPQMGRQRMVDVRVVVWLDCDMVVVKREQLHVCETQLGGLFERVWVDSLDRSPEATRSVS